MAEVKLTTSKFVRSKEEILKSGYATVYELFVFQSPQEYFRQAEEVEKKEQDKVKNRWEILDL